MQNTGEPMPKFFTGLDLKSLSSWANRTGTEAEIWILIGLNFDQYRTDWEKNYLEHRQDMNPVHNISGKFCFHMRLKIIKS